MNLNVGLASFTTRLSLSGAGMLRLVLNASTPKSRKSFSFRDNSCNFFCLSQATAQLEILLAHIF